MVQIEDSILYQEVHEIITNVDSKNHNIDYYVMVHTVDIDYTVKLVESVEILRDYNSNISDYVLATFMIPAGDYVHDIHNHKDHLQITLIRSINGVELKQRFKFLISNNKTSLENSRYSNSSRDELNGLEMIRVEGQCIDMLTETLRMVYVEGIYRSVNIEKLLKVKFDKGISPLGLSDNLVIDIVTPDNTRQYDHIEVPTGLDLISLPTYLQDDRYGVYNGNIGTYLQFYKNKATLFVYPLYSPNRFKKSEKKLMIYGVTSAKFDFVEHTYLEDGDLVKIIAGKSTVGINTGEDAMIDQGVGFTRTDPNKIMARNSEVSDGNVMVDQEHLNVGQKFKNKQDGNNKTRHIGPTDNLYKYRSDIVKNSMATYQLQWNHCDPDLIYPGMPAMYIFLKDVDEIVKLNGTVQSIFIMNNIGTNTVNAMLNIMVEKPNITE